MKNGLFRIWMARMERLKRQENAKRPTDLRFFQHDGYHGKCPYCKRCVDFAQKYCHNCTQLLDWQEVMEVVPKDGDGE